MKKNKNIKNALISVFDKTNIINLAQQLVNKNINIFATNNTEHILKKNNIPVKNIYEITKSKEMLNSQIKTIHPKIFAGILGNKYDYYDDIKNNKIILFDLVIINFYSFTDVSSSKDLEHLIDIGGPAMVRASAKNYKYITIVTDITDYNKIIKEININGQTTLLTKLELATKAFEYVNQYDYLISQYFKNKLNHYNKMDQIFPDVLHIQYQKKQNLKYGENPHQKAALYIKRDKKTMGSIDSMKQVNGTELSYNNIYDAHIAYECANQLIQPTCVIVKHGNPCGASSNLNILQSYLNAYNSNPISAFGGIIGFNKKITTKLISTIIEKQFVEIIIGPDITKNAIHFLKQYKKIKVLILGYYIYNNTDSIEFKSINNTLLIQEIDNHTSTFKQWTIVTNKQPTILEKQYAIFNWKINKFIKSNAIVYSHKYNIVGIGSGQTNRLESVNIANQQYQNNKDIFHLNDKNIIMTSDAFFPFRDSIDTCITNKKISCIIQPGGSIRDKEVIQAANEHNICMIFTHNRQFKH